jgi:signal transduction histidine kinase
MEFKEVKGFALLCDSSGIITNVLRDDVELSESNIIGKLFVNLVNSESRRESLDFLLEIKQQKISFDRRLGFQINQKNYAFYFIGIELISDLLIIGADNHKEAVDFANHLQQINNEQSNLIRHLLKKDITRTYETPDDSRLLFDEITNLNNELVNLQREMTRKNIELERLNELKNRFLGMAAHDLRNPLGIVMNYSDFLIDEVAASLSEEHQKFLHIINDSAEFMLHLVEELLDFSKIQTGKIELHLSEYDFVSQCKRQSEILNTLSAKKNISIIFKSNVKSVMLLADTYKLDQVIGNIVNNAIKFSYPNSEILMKIKKDVGRVVLSVTDKGKGIKPENIEKVFVPFSKLSTSGTAGEKGTGLGLSIVKRIVEAHGGDIRIESDPDGISGEKGTTFFVSLPLKVK